MRAISFIWLCALLAGACAHEDRLVISAETMLVAADIFVATAEAADKAHEAHQITDQQYKEWAVFGRKFQAIYPVCVDTWRVARLHGDPQLEATMLLKVNELVKELLAYRESL